MSRNAKWGHTPTKRGVCKGGASSLPLAHNLWNKGVVCYTCWRGWREKCGCRMMDTHILSDRKTGRILQMVMSKILFVFISGGGYTKLLSIVYRKNILSYNVGPDVNVISNERY